MKEGSGKMKTDVVNEERKRKGKRRGKEKLRVEKLEDGREKT